MCPIIDMQLLEHLENLIEAGVESRRRILYDLSVCLMVRNFLEQKHTSTIVKPVLSNRSTNSWSSEMSSPALSARRVLQLLRRSAKATLARLSSFKRPSGCLLDLNSGHSQSPYCITIGWRPVSVGVPGASTLVSTFVSSGAGTGATSLSSGKSLGSSGKDSISCGVVGLLSSACWDSTAAAKSATVCSSGATACCSLSSCRASVGSASS